MGGFYWCLSLVLGQAACFAAGWLYVATSNAEAGRAEGGAAGLEGSTISKAVWALFCAWSFAILGLLLSIDRSYLHTFFDLASGKQFVVREFRASATDFEKIQVISYHPSFYASNKAEVKAWLGENYEHFEREQPEWWTALVISGIPDEYIPKEELKILEGKGVGGKRKTSSVGVFGGVRVDVEGEAKGDDEAAVSKFVRRLSNISLGIGLQQKARVIPVVGTAVAVAGQQTGQQAAEDDGE